MLSPISRILLSVFAATMSSAATSKAIATSQKRLLPSYWLLKSEPDEFGIADLKMSRTAPWDGIRNFQARNFIQKEMKEDDVAFFYHSSCKKVGIYGKMRIAGEAFVDPTAFDTTSDYYDIKSTSDNPKWYGINVEFQQEYSTPLLLAAPSRNSTL